MRHYRGAKVVQGIRDAGPGPIGGLANYDRLLVLETLEMNDQIDARLLIWVGDVIGKDSVTLSLPPETSTGASINLYLLSFANCPSPRTTKRPPLQLLLRYLVTSSAENPQKAHDLLVQLAFAAMQEPEYAVELDPLPAESWLALKVTPRPSFILSMPVRQQRDEHPVKYVRTQLSLQTEPTTEFVGRLIGPNDIPIVGARVELPALQLFNYTDSNGQFHFAALPSQTQKRDLVILAKGRLLKVTIPQSGGPGEPVVIHLNPLEAQE